MNEWMIWGVFALFLETPISYRHGIISWTNDLPPIRQVQKAAQRDLDSQQGEWGNTFKSLPLLVVPNVWDLNKNTYIYIYLYHVY